MRATHPNQITDLMLVALNAHDTDAVVALYEASAIIADDLLAPKTGRDAIRQQVGGFLDLGPSFEVHHSEVAQTGDIALIQSHWSLAWTNPDGKAANNEVKVSLIARRQKNGHWLIVIDRPIEIG